MTCFHPITVYQTASYPLSDVLGFKVQPNERILKPLNKIKWKEQPNTFKIQIPCGRCLGCRLDHANDWATRCWCELQEWGQGCFVTLTYNSARRNKKRTGGDKYEWNLPMTSKGEMTLYKKDTINFMKRLRKKHHGLKWWTNPVTGKTEAPIRFFSCGEMGPTKGRPHYHFCLFNYIPNDLVFDRINQHGQRLYKSKSLSKIWGHGFVIIGELNYQSACYVARYVQKKAGVEPIHHLPEEYEYYEDLDDLIDIWDLETGEIHKAPKFKRRLKKDNEEKPEKEFVNMSRSPGIGLKYFMDNKEKIMRNSGILIKIENTVKNKKVPKYFKKKWEQMDFEEYHRWRYKQILRGKENHIKLMSHYKYATDDIEEKTKIWLAEQERLLNKKAPLLRRDNIENTLLQPPN